MSALPIYVSTRVTRTVGTANQRLRSLAALRRSAAALNVATIGAVAASRGA